MASEERFGYEWKKYSHMTPAYEGQFRNWTNLSPTDFVGKDVLDAGCGMGRNSYWPLTWGARSLIAFDNDEASLQSARTTLAGFKNVSIQQCDISQTPWENEFDIVLCIGVLHHLRQPRLALENFVRALRPKGKLIIWVYSYEGNEWIVRFINPIRTHITSKLPVSLVHMLTYGASVPLYYIGIPLLRRRSSYLQQLSTFSFWHVHSIVFDQLIPTVAHYWRKEEIEALVEGLSVTQVSVRKPQNGMGWILSILKK